MVVKTASPTELKNFSSGRTFRMVGAFQKFFTKMVSGSFPLFFAAVTALLWANASPSTYHGFWHTDISLRIGSLELSKSVAHWIDEALMVLFFFIVGLEIKREILVGELASLKRAILPVVAALGGMLVPAVIYIALNHHTPYARGWGIPMATDIAFSLAILAALGPRTPFGIRIFLSALAIADDLGAVLVIAVFYTETIAWNYLLMAAVFLGGLVLSNLLWIRWALVYVLLGIALWLAILGSGIHATIAGVLVASCIPARGKYDTATFISKVQAYLGNIECEKEQECGFTILMNKDHQNAVQSIEIACHEVETPLQRLEHSLYPWVTLVILPLFALANAGIVFNDLKLTEAVMHPVFLGVFLGLFVGKPLGITVFTYLSVKFLKTSLMPGITWHHIIGAAILGGIGFTMSLFISGLSFAMSNVIEISKFGIVVGSVFAGVTGLLFFAAGQKAVKNDG